MRIDLFNSSAGEVSNELSSQPVDTQNAALSEQGGTEDRATLTSDSATVTTLVSAAMNSPEVRQGTVDSLRQAVSSGQYDLDPDQIAASMVDDYA